MRAFALILAGFAAISLSGCDASDPLGLHPEPAKQVDAPLELTGRVVDAAEILSNGEEQKLAASLAEIEKSTQAQLVVVTTPSLEGRSIADYSLMLGRGWGIGSKARNDGLLLVVAPNERQVRIEVGYGLERTVEDPEAAEIIRQIIPHFEQGDLPAGIVRGVELLELELRTPKLENAA